jgi:hypothetical protein
VWVNGDKAWPQPAVAAAAPAKTGKRRSAA